MIQASNRTHNIPQIQVLALSTSNPENRVEPCKLIFVYRR